MNSQKITFLFLLIFLPGMIFSLPRFAVQQFDNCSSCHVNPTGGLIRNEGGFGFGRYLVSMISPRDEDIKLSPKISDNILFGFDYRTQYLYSQEKERTDFQEMTGSVYTAVELSTKISAVARYDFVQYIWEAYGIARVLPNESYIKVGSFQPDFGIRIDDHSAYTRGGDHRLISNQSASNGLIYNPFYVETGIELGANFHKYAHMTFSIGKPRSRRTLTQDPVYTTRLEFNPVISKIGLSIGGSYAAVKTSYNTSLYGGFLGVGYKKFALLAEYDMADNYFGQDIKSSFLMAKATYRIITGLEAIIRYDMVDPDRDTEKDELSRLIAGFEFFPYSFIELRPQYRMNFEENSIDNDAFVLQFHIWY